MTRKEKFGGSRDSKLHEKAVSPSDIETNSNEGSPMPPRRKRHPSSNYKLTKWCLVVVLFWYGNKFTE
jgi:hypothetical protein